MTFEILAGVCIVTAVWWASRLPKVLKQTAQDIKELEQLFDHRYACTDCNHHFNTLKREIDTNGDEWIDMCPYCGSTNYESNEQDTIG